MTWFLTASWEPTADASRSSLEVRCGGCARTTLRSLQLAPPAVVAWLAEQEARCAGCGERVEAPRGATGGER